MSFGKDTKHIRRDIRSSFEKDVKDVKREILSSFEKDIKDVRRENRPQSSNKTFSDRGLTSELNYTNELRRKLNEVLLNIADNESLIAPEAMIYWTDAFTSPLWSLDHNYDILSQLGETVSTFVFTNYMVKNYPELTPETLALSKSNFLTQESRAEMVTEMGLDEYVRISPLPTATTKIKADLFNSFFGALFEIGERLGECLGFLLASEMMEYIIRGVLREPINLQGGIVSTKDRIVKILAMFGHKQPHEDLHQNKDKTYNATVYIDKDASSFFNINPLIGYGTGFNKTNALKDAYNSALKTLEKYGITWDSAKQFKRKTDFASRNFDSYRDILFSKAKEEGYKDIYFRVPSEGRAQTGSVVQLIGVGARGDEKIISSVFDKNVEEGKIFAIRNYITS